MNFPDILKKFNELYYEKLTTFFPFLFLVYLSVLLVFSYKRFELVKFYYYDNTAFKTLCFIVRNFSKLFITLIINSIAFGWLIFLTDQHLVLNELYDNFLTPLNIYEYRIRFGDNKDPDYPSYQPWKDLDETTFFIKWRTQFPVPPVSNAEIKEARIKYLTHLHGSEGDPELTNVYAQKFPKYDTLSEKDAPAGYFDNRPEDYFKPENQFYALQPLRIGRHYNIPDYRLWQKFFEEFPVSIRFTSEPPVSLDYDEYMKTRDPDTISYDRDIYLYKIAGYNDRANKIIIEPVVYKRKKILDRESGFGVTVDYTPLFDDTFHQYDRHMVRLLRAFKCDTFKEIYEKSCNGELYGLIERTVVTPEQQQSLKVWHPVHSVLMIRDYFDHHILKECVHHPKSFYKDVVTPFTIRERFLGVLTPLHHWRNLTHGAIEQTMVYNLQMYYRVATLTENWWNTILTYDKVNVRPTTLDVYAIRFSSEICGANDDLTWRFEGPFGAWIWAYGISLHYSTLRPLFECRGALATEGQYIEESNYLFDWIIRRVPDFCETQNIYIKQHLHRVFCRVYFPDLITLKTKPVSEWNDYARIRQFLGNHIAAWHSTHHKHSIEDGGLYDPWSAVRAWQMGVAQSEVAMRLFMKYGV